MFTHLVKISYTYIIFYVFLLLPSNEIEHMSILCEIGKPIKTFFADILSLVLSDVGFPILNFPFFIFKFPVLLFASSVQIFLKIKHTDFLQIHRTMNLIHIDSIVDSVEVPLTFGNILDENDQSREQESCF